MIIYTHQDNAAAQRGMRLHRFKDVVMKFKNYTPHMVNLNDGREFASEGVARLSVSFSTPDENGLVRQVFGEIEGLPEPEKDTMFIVSLIVLQASERRDLVAPATGHPDTVRKDGKIVSVPYFVTK